MPLGHRCVHRHSRTHTHSHTSVKTSMWKGELNAEFKQGATHICVQQHCWQVKQVRDTEVLNYAKTD